MIHGVPSSTYRLQINSSFTFSDAADQIAYLADLGVSHVFLSPVLQASPGSTHGYDVVDHSLVCRDNGGEEGLRSLAQAAHSRGLKLVVDVVPNHVAVPTPLWLNRELWDVLTHGAASRFAHWFDIDFSRGGFLLPVLGEELGTVLEKGEIRKASVEVRGIEVPVLTYYDHVFPLAPGTEALEVPKALSAQNYRLVSWRRGNTELNYRRFFDVTTLLGLRVELPDVFAASHRTLFRLQQDGVIDGYRIDHPDGLADPRGYLRDLAGATGGAWTVVEKILEGNERLPSDFAAAGTTGYDALWRVSGLFHSPAGKDSLSALWEQFSGETLSLREVTSDAAELVVSTSLKAEVARLVALAQRALLPAQHGNGAGEPMSPATQRIFSAEDLRLAIVGLLLSMDRYRAYVVPGEPAPENERAVLNGAAERARPALPASAVRALDAVLALACGDHRGDTAAEFVVRFAQTCGPVHAKSLEDTTFYRFNRFLAVNEVGSDPDRIGVSPREFHEYAQFMLATWPHAMTTLSTHDTKRSEDVRARLAVITELPERWKQTVDQLRAATADVRGARVDGAMEYLVWQTLVATSPMRASQAPALTRDRLCAYLEKAMREAKVHTAWVDGDSGYEHEVLDFACAALESGEVAGIIAEWNRATEYAQEAAIVGQKLVQLIMPGVPDIYQGNEVVDFSLVDPDNRRPVDFDRRRGLLKPGSATAANSLDVLKLRVTHAALQTRSRFNAAFVGPDSTYEPLFATTDHVIAFSRGTTAEGPKVVTIAARLLHVLEAKGGWGEHSIQLPAGDWRCAITGRRFSSNGTAPEPLVEIVRAGPVALLVKEGA